MMRRPPRSTRTATLCPYPTLCRAGAAPQPRLRGRAAEEGADRRLPRGRGRGPGRPLPAQDVVAAAGVNTIPQVGTFVIPGEARDLPRRQQRIPRFARDDSATFATARPPHGSSWPEIGRASRRERGCPYVLISVVAVALTKTI